MHITGIFALAMASVFCAACQTAQKADAIISIDASKAVSTDYIGNGVEWDPYELDYGFGRVEISEQDWDKLFARLDYMRPRFIRMIFMTGEYVRDGKFDFGHDSLQVSKMLGYCQKNGITVLIGDWGHGMVDFKNKTFDRELLDDAIRYADWLVNVKGYTCIKYYNIINEPNGSWSETKGDYELWASIVRYFNSRMKECGLDSKVGLVGPDAAVWDTSENWWIDRCATDLDGAVKLYDIHTYPTKATVNSGDYSTFIKSYKARIPEGSKIVMAEIGLKPVPGDSLDRINRKRIDGMPFASRNDSQTAVFDHYYGVDMADAVIQAMNAGFSGASAWMLDDAMHSNLNEGRGKLKIWGFWNILGEEYFGGAEQEKVREPFYAWSLMDRYFPAGSKICPVSVEGTDEARRAHHGRLQLRAAAAECWGKWTVAIVNPSKDELNVMLKGTGIPELKDVSEYDYARGMVIKEGDCTQLPNRTGLAFDLSKGHPVNLPGESLVVLTNMD
jgi:hypothetical protein